MTAAENIRAYLDARATSGDTVKNLGNISESDGHRLTETDLEVVLQMLDLLARIIDSRNTEPVTPERLITWAESQIIGPPRTRPTS